MLIRIRAFAGATEIDPSVLTKEAEPERETVSIVAGLPLTKSKSRASGAFQGSDQTTPVPTGDTTEESATNAAILLDANMQTSSNGLNVIDSVFGPQLSVRLVDAIQGTCSRCDIRAPSGRLDSTGTDW